MLQMLGQVMNDVMGKVVVQWPSPCIKLPSSKFLRLQNS